MLQVDGSSKFHTWRGAAMTLIIYFLIAIFGLQKFLTMKNRDDTVATDVVIKTEMDPNTIIPADDIDFEFAFVLYKQDPATKIYDLIT